MLWNGNIHDSTDLPPKRYLQVNSCGYQNPKIAYSVIRENGRRDHHILLIESGECTAEYKGESYTLKSGDYILYPPSVRQFYSFSSPCTSLWCHFTGTVTDEILSDLEIECGVFSSTQKDKVFGLFHEMIRHFHSVTEKNSAYSDLINILCCISPSNAQKSSSNDCRISDALNYIHANYREQISVETLSKTAGYSESRFDRIFKLSTGATPIQYLNNIRLEYATDLLRATSLSVTEIAVSCGFNDPLYFSRSFKKKYSCSPSEYRAKSSY